MIFDEELTLLKEKIANAEDVDELNYIRTTNQKKYWWTSIFIAGLFYGLNGKVGKMIITWFVSVITLGIYALYIIYRSYNAGGAVCECERSLGRNAAAFRLFLRGESHLH